MPFFLDEDILGRVDREAMPNLILALFYRKVSNLLWNEIAYPSVDTAPLGSGLVANHSFNLSNISSNHSSAGGAEFIVP